jgi:hypothetical protein
VTHIKQQPMIRTLLALLPAVAFAGDPFPPTAGVTAATGGLSCKDAKDAYMSSSCCSAADPDATDYVLPLSPDCGAVTALAVFSMPVLSSGTLAQFAAYGIDITIPVCDVDKAAGLECSTEETVIQNAINASNPAFCADGWGTYNAAIPSAVSGSCKVCGVGDEFPGVWIMGSAMVGETLGACGGSRRLAERPAVSISPVKMHRKLSARKLSGEGDWYTGTAGLTLLQDYMINPDPAVNSMGWIVVADTYASFLEAINGFSMMGMMMGPTGGYVKFDVYAPAALHNRTHTWSEYDWMTTSYKTTTASLFGFVGTLTGTNTVPSSLVAPMKELCKLSSMP